MGRRTAQLVCAIFGVLLFLLFFVHSPIADKITLKITTDYSPADSPRLAARIEALIETARGVMWPDDSSLV